MYSVWMSPPKQSCPPFTHTHPCWNGKIYAVMAQSMLGIKTSHNYLIHNSRKLQAFMLSLQKTIFEDISCNKLDLTWKKRTKKTFFPGQINNVTVFKFPLICNINDEFGRKMRRILHELKDICRKRIKFMYIYFHVRICNEFL